MLSVLIGRLRKEPRARAEPVAMGGAVRPLGAASGPHAALVGTESNAPSPPVADEMGRAASAILHLDGLRALSNPQLKGRCGREALRRDLEPVEAQLDVDPPVLALGVVGDRLERHKGGEVVVLVAVHVADGKVKTRDVAVNTRVCPWGALWDREAITVVPARRLELKRDRAAARSSRH